MPHVRSHTALLELDGASPEKSPEAERRAAPSGAIVVGGAGGVGEQPRLSTASEEAMKEMSRIASVPVSLSAMDELSRRASTPIPSVPISTVTVKLDGTPSSHPEEGEAAKPPSDGSGSNEGNGPRDA